MHLHNGVGMLWASIRDPLPDRRPSDKRMLGGHIGPGESDYTRYDRTITDLAVEWLTGKGRTAREPWCLYVGLVAPHFPLVAPQQFYDLYPLDMLPEPKLHPRDGYDLHPWLQEHEDFWSHEATLKDEHERRMAIAAYYGLVSWLDHNIGRHHGGTRGRGPDRQDARDLCVRSRRQSRRARALGQIQSLSRIRRYPDDRGGTGLRTWRAATRR